MILVNNASTECPPEMFHEVFPDITLVKNNENRGFAKGCNDGIAHAKGEYILLLNSDTILLNNAIGICLEHLKAKPDNGVVTCRLENSDGTPQNNCQRFPSYWLSLAEKLRLHKLYPKKKRGTIWLGPYFDYASNANPDWVWGTFFMFRKDLLDVFPDKKLTETFWMYVEDMEWCWIANKAGRNVVFTPDGIVLHYGGNEAKSEKIKKMIDNNFRKFLKLYY